MSSARRSTLLAGAFALCAGLGTGTARAQMNTYADFPYNQGSLFYRYGASPGRSYYAPRRQVYVPQTYYAPRQPVYSYAPQPGYSSYYVAPGGYYYPPRYQYQYPQGMYYGRRW